MGRKSRKAFTALQGAEAQKLLALQAIPPAPGEVRRRTPTIRTDMPTYAQPEFMAWFYASQQAKDDGSWAVGLDAAGQGGPALAAEQAGRATAATYSGTVSPPYERVDPVAADPVAGPDYWGAGDMGEGRTVTRYGDEGPAGELLTQEAAAVEAEAGSSNLLLVALVVGGVYLAYRVFRG